MIKSASNPADWVAFSSVINGPAEYVAGTGIVGALNDAGDFAHLVGIFCHEIGHYLGLYHTCDTFDGEMNLMHPVIKDLFLTAQAIETCPFSPNDTVNLWQDQQLVILSHLMVQQPHDEWVK